MSLLPYSWADPFSGGNVFDPLAFGFGTPATTRQMQLPSMQQMMQFVSAPMDIQESDNAYDIYADVPGMSPDDITLEYQDQNQVLTIKGEHVQRDFKEGSGFTRTERTRRSFTRSFTVPSDAVAEEISASVENGVLNVRVPKRPSPEQAKYAPRRIPITPGTGGRAQIGGAGTESGRATEPTPGRSDVGGAGDVDVGSRPSGQVTSTGVPVKQRIIIETVKPSGAEGATAAGDVGGGAAGMGEGGAGGYSGGYTGGEMGSGDVSMGEVGGGGGAGYGRTTAEGGAGYTGAGYTGGDVGGGTERSMAEGAAGYGAGAGGAGYGGGDVGGTTAGTTGEYAEGAAGAVPIPVRHTA